MTRKQFDYDLFHIALLVLLVLAILTAPAFAQICPDAKMLDASPAANCFEFWLNRYQTLLGTIVGAIAVLVAYVGLRQQMSLERELSKSEVVENWRLWCRVAEETCNLIQAALPVDNLDDEDFEQNEIFNRYLPGAITVDVYVEANLSSLEQIRARLRPALQPDADRFLAALRTIGGLSRWLLTSNNASTPTAKRALKQLITLIFNARWQIQELKKVEG